MSPLKLKLLKQLDRYPMDKAARGFVRFFAFNRRTGEIVKIVERSNLILFEGADALAQCLVGNADYAVRVMYMEFKNLASPGDPITPPIFDRSGGIAYYNGLSASLDTDFLRIPLTLNPTVSTSGSEYEGNQATFFGISEGTTGFNGKLFNESVNSAVYGAGLISAPVIDSQASDKVFSRVYAGIDKVLKAAGYEIGVTWTIRFN
jgi:hypothetical protein